MSYTAVVLPILAALQIAEQAFLGPERAWQPVNVEQRLFLKDYWSKKDELRALLPEELKSYASKSIDAVNKFLADNGFTIKLDQLPPGIDGFAVASILTILLEWEKEGKETQLTIEGKTALPVPLKTYSAVSLTEGYKVLKTSNGELILAVKAKNGDTVYMTVASEPLQGFELMEKIQSLSQSTYMTVTRDFERALFPMVDLDHSMALNWLIGLWTSAQNGIAYEVYQALQQTRFQMNEKGAAAQSAVAISFIEMTCIPAKPKPDFVIDKPFYLWIERKGMSLPLFAAYIDTPDWKKPEKLGR